MFLQDIDAVLKLADHRGPMAALTPIFRHYGQTLLSLCVSDINKDLVLSAEGCIPLLVDSLLLDPEHPRREQPDFDAVAPAVQQDFAEAIAQLAMFGPGREKLVQVRTTNSPTVLSLSLYIYKVINSMYVPCDVCLGEEWFCCMRVVEDTVPCVFVHRIRAWPRRCGRSLLRAGQPKRD
jgi:hypothetical protein